MSVAIRGSYFFVQPGEKALKVSSNFTNYVELGAQGITEYYLKARVENGEVLIDATLLDPRGRIACRIANNFPVESECRRELTPNGYRIISPSGDLILGVEMQGDIATLQGTIYDATGGIVAEEIGDDFLIYRGPAALGKSGQSLGVVVK